MAETAATLQEIDIEIERIAAHSTGWTMPCLWVSHHDMSIVEEHFRQDSTVDEVRETTAFEDEAFFHVEWSETVQERITSYIDKSGSLLEARLTEGRWRLVLRFTSRNQFDAFRAHVTEQGHSIDLIGLSEPETPRQGYRDLTPKQNKMLVSAAMNGYFSVPRETTIADLAAEFDISHQAASELLRRGIESLIFSTITTEERSKD